MIKLKQLKKTYPNGTHALDNINLTVAKGNICGVIGKSGAGKSTLIRCVNLLEQPSEGSLHVDGVDMLSLAKNDLREARRHMGMIFQHFNLLSSRTVYENIALPLELIHEKKEQIENKVSALLELVGLSDKRNTYPSQLSGGQKQRVAIARALANDPKVLLCDEATSALDPETTQSILTLLKDINKKLNLTILIITHEIDVVKQICDQVVILEAGKLIEEGSVFDVFSQPKSELAKSFIRTALHLDLAPEVETTLHADENKQQPPVLRIEFIGEAASEPIISQLVSKYNVHCNILQANIEIVQEQTFGVMVLEAQGEPDNVKSSIDYLKQQDIRVEVVRHDNR
tara:strand:+ start:233107 stop:234135 length:1029 start_codon:yes stop_codon:yes gene_type:complete